MLPTSNPNLKLLPLITLDFAQLIESFNHAAFCKATSTP